MIIILLSGGSGERLWPLSNEARSKQFLNLLHNDNGIAESMVQRVYKQIKQVHVNANIIIATNKAQLDSIVSQLDNNVEIVLEPERRNTFPAIAIASAYLALIKKVHLNEVVMVLPIDQYVDLEYFSLLAKMESLVNGDIANLVLMGIKPKYPSEKYGYIVPSPDNRIFVDRFIEKPTADNAAILIKQNALWNGGVFAYRLSYLMGVIERYIDFETYEDVISQYSVFPNSSFDYEITEKETSMAMVEYSGVWMDLGTWNTITDVMDSTVNGNVILADTCENTHAINTLDIPAVVMGIKNAVVVASPDGILVSDKTQSSFIKKYIGKLKKRPMYGEYRWGNYRVLENTHYEDTETLIKHLFIKSGETVAYHFHNLRDEILIVVNGSCICVVDEKTENVKAGHTLTIPKCCGHSLKANEDLHLIEIQLGKELLEDDVFIK